MKKLSIAVAVLAAVASGYANAEVRVNGFASIVGGKTMDADTTRYGYDNDMSFKNESVFALQVTADLQDKLTATSQIVASGKNDFNAEFEWAYLTYEFTEDLQVSAGKMRAPFYRYSDFLDVGYTYRWVRPPQSVYNLPFTSFDGLSVLYSTELGDWDSTLQVFYGGFDGEVPVITSSDDTELNNLAGLNLSLSRDWFSAHAAYVVSEVDVNVDPGSAVGANIQYLDQALRLSGFGDHADNLAIKGDDGYFLSLGFSIDYGNFLFDTEYTQFEVDNSALAKQKQYYSSLGYRMDEVLVHFTYEDNDDGHDESRYDQLAAIPSLNGAVNGVLDGAKFNSNVYTLGARYDFHSSAALKVDFSRHKDRITDLETDVMSVGIDLVF